MSSGKSRIPGPRVAGGRPAARLTRPLRAFLETEVGSGVALMAAVVVAMIWANSPWSGAYDTLWHTEASIDLGPWTLSEDLRHWVNDGLMVIFFFVVGLEIKREMVRGELRDRKKALLPVAAALGGMVVPAALYLVLNVGGEGSHGWGVPMATDIALALGVLALFGERIPSELRIFLLSLAIVDDVGAILVIAVFYTDDISVPALAVAVALLGLVVVLRSLRVWWVPAYVAVGTAVWVATLLSGIHATIAGVALGLMAPARPLRSPNEGADRATGPTEASGSPADVRKKRVSALSRIPVTERLEYALHPWTSYAILPLFALANAGIRLVGEDLGGSLTSMVTLGVVAGLVVGKGVGIFGFAWLATKIGARLPRVVAWPQVAGVALLGGIGFTMSLFIGTLAFRDGDLVEQAKIGILFGSTIAALLGALVLARAGGDESP